MEKVIKVDLQTKEDVYETFDMSIVSSDLVDYLVRRAIRFSKKDQIKVIVNDYVGIDNCEELIKEGLKIDYIRYYHKYRYNNISQLIYTVLGILIIFVATYLGDTSVLHEILLICGWVLIWEMFEIEVFTDLENRRRRRILKRLKKATYVINKKGD